MKRIRRLLVPTEGPSSALTPFATAGILVITAAVGLTAWQEKAPAPAPQSSEVSPFTKWLNEDAVYIITNDERAAFKLLETDAEHEQFIQQFWLRRDPTPGTPENEFRDEHYRRIAFANLHFPIADGTAGWKTDGDASILSSARPMRSTIILPRALTATLSQGPIRFHISTGPIALSTAWDPM